MEKTNSSDTSSSSLDILQTHWIQAQEALKRNLITDDDHTWRFQEGGDDVSLRYVGGVDISFSKEDTSLACAALVVVDIEQALQVVYDDYSVVRLIVPYVPGFLAFREAPILLQLLEKMKNSDHSFYPQLLMVDGNGLLHPRGFGLACHLGVLANLPTIGVGKNLHHVDGLNQCRVRQLLEDKGSFDEEIFTLIGDSGQIWGAAMRSTQGSLKPIYISTGHRVSLDTAVRIAKFTCKYRIPEPIRQIDNKVLFMDNPNSLVSKAVSLHSETRLDNLSFQISVNLMKFRNLEPACVVKEVLADIRSRDYLQNHL